MFDSKHLKRIITLKHHKFLIDMIFSIIFLANIHYHSADKTSSAKDEIKQHIKFQPSWGRATLVVKSGSPPVVFLSFLRENSAP